MSDMEEKTIPFYKESIYNIEAQTVSMVAECTTSYEKE